MYRLSGDHSPGSGTGRSIKHTADDRSDSHNDKLSPVYRTHKLSVHREDSAISVRALVGHEVGHRSEAGERMRRCTGCTLYKTKCTRQAIKRTHPTHPPMTNPAPPGPDHVTIAKGVGRKN